MTYPSLINIGIPQQQKISAEVFEDTRLSSLIDNDAVAVMQKPCSGEDISERQRLFLALLGGGSDDSLSNGSNGSKSDGDSDGLNCSKSDGDSDGLNCSDSDGLNGSDNDGEGDSDTELLTQFIALRKTADYINSLYLDYSNSVSREEKAVLCALILQNIAEFSISASELADNTPLCKRFSDSFRNFCQSEAFTSLKHDLADITSALQELRSYICRISGSMHYLALPENKTISGGKNDSITKNDSENFDDTSGNGYLSRLINCAKKFGLGEINPESVIPHRLTAGIMYAASRLHPQEFNLIAGFAEKYQSIIDPEFLGYRTQLGFYISVCRLIQRIKSAGIPICYPSISEKKQIILREAFDITLLEKGEKNIIPNNADFTEAEPFFFLTGANGGGKTTYLRTVGVSVLMFLAGAPIPCKSADIFPLSCVFTHFPHDERFELSGRFIDEQERVNDILLNSEVGCLVLLNETYSTTSEQKAIRCTSELAEKLYKKGVFGVYVTHHKIGVTYENSEKGLEIPMLNVLLDKDGTKRTYKIARRTETESSHAQDILKKYRLDFNSLKERFGD